ncbi:MAG: hypothetical protein U1F15_11395 [Burkholderiales bacterium]
MGFFDRLRDGTGVQRPLGAGTPDEQAIARYRYLLKTAPPETIEQAHAEAFAQLTPDQRRRVLQELAAAVPEGGERTAVMRAGDSPDALARVATRAELRQPGVLERVFGGPGAAGPGFGTLFAGSLLASMAGTVLGSLIAQQFFHAHPFGAGFGADGVDAAPHDVAAGDIVTADDAGGFDTDFDAGTFDV